MFWKHPRTSPTLSINWYNIHLIILFFKFKVENEIYKYNGKILHAINLKENVFKFFYNQK